jgi:uncharacterized protein RhaS with RHS repeats
LKNCYIYRARYYDPKVGRFVTKDPIGFKGGINQYAYAGNNSINNTDPLGLCSKECPYCPGGEWTSFSKLTTSVFWGGGVILGKPTYTCKSNGKKCTATSICFGGGAIGSVGIGPDAGGQSGLGSGVVNTFCPSDFEKFSYGVYVVGGPVSVTKTGNSTSGGGSVGLGFGVAYVTCVNIYVTCDK